MEATSASDKGRLDRQGVASLAEATEGNPAGVSAENRENPRGSISRSFTEKTEEQRENPEGNPEKRLVLRLRRLLEERGALFSYDEEAWTSALSSLLNRGFSEKEIEVAMEYSQQDEFWAGKVADLGDLARHFESVVQQARRWHNGRLRGASIGSKKNLPRRDGPYPPAHERTRQDWFDIYRELLDEADWPDSDLWAVADELVEAYR